MAIYNSILDTIGNTPLVKLNKIKEKYDLPYNLYAKLESFNPSNNVKTRPAYYMIKKMYENRIIDEDYTLIESSSGNTGIGIAMVGAYFGNEVIIVMPESVSKERVQVLKHYGSQVILTKAEDGITGSNIVVKELLKKNKKAVQPSQFENENNPMSHYLTTAVELDKDLPKIDYIFSVIGTGGTITGVGRYFKEKGYETKIIGIEPLSSPVITGGKPGKHKIQGAGPGFIPEIYNPNFVDEVVKVSDDDAYKFTKLIPRIEGISVGISAGACLIAAMNYLKEKEVRNKDIVLIFPDSGEKYFSTGVFD